MKQNSKILRFVAEHSPKWMARNVRERFEEVLRMLHRYKAMADENSQLRLGYARSNGVMAGCPHCDDFQCHRPNTHCLYVEAYARYGLGVIKGEYPCARVEFGGFTLNEVCRDEGYRVSLSSDKVDVECRIPSYADPDGVKASYKRCVKFCEAHIAWTKNPKWGSKRYKKARKQ